MGIFPYSPTACNRARTARSIPGCTGPRNTEPPQVNILQQWRVIGCIHTSGNQLAFQIQSLIPVLVPHRDWKDAAQLFLLPRMTSSSSLQEQHTLEWIYGYHARQLHCVLASHTTQLHHVFWIGQMLASHASSETQAKSINVPHSGLLTILHICTPLRPSH